MPRTLSSNAVAALMAQSTDKVFLVLLTIDHPDLGTPFRLVNNTEDVTSNGDLYTAYPFEISFPSEDGENISSASLILDNVDQLLVSTIRSLQSEPTVQLNLVIFDTPDVVEAGPMDFLLRGVKYDSFKIVAELTFEPILQEPFPKDIMSPKVFPGLFRV